MNAMSSTSYSLTTRPAAPRIARAYDGPSRAPTRGMAAARPRPGGRRRIHLPRWALHAAIGALTLSPLGLARVWGLPLTAPLSALEVRVLPRGPAADDTPIAFTRASLPALGPLAED